MSSTNDTGTTAFPHAKEWSYILTSQCAESWTQNGSILEILPVEKYLCVLSFNNYYQKDIKRVDSILLYNNDKEEEVKVMGVKERKASLRC